jgi:hypothetical protein
MADKPNTLTVHLVDSDEEYLNETGRIAEALRLRAEIMEKYGLDDFSLFRWGYAHTAEWIKQHPEKPVIVVVTHPEFDTVISNPEKDMLLAIHPNVVNASGALTPGNAIDHVEEAVKAFFAKKTSAE